MSEDNFSIKSGQSYRGTRYPGFSSGGTDSNGNVAPISRVANPTATFSAGTGETAGSPAAAAATSLAAQTYDIPKADIPQVPSMGDMAVDLGKSAAGSAGTWAATQIGKNAGSAIANGAGLGEGISAGASQLADRVSGWFGSESGSVAGSAASSTTNGAVSNAMGNSAAAVGPLQSEAPMFSQTENWLTSGSSIGGAAGAGLGTAVIGMAMGQDPEEAVISGAGAGAGYYVGGAIGTAILPGAGGMIGGLVGSTLGAMFCYVSGTLIRMQDGTTKAVEDLDIGDLILVGDMVVGTGKILATDLFRYRGETVNGSHAVFEDGRWIRVRDSAQAERIEVDGPVVVYPIVTENHLMVTASGIISADFAEVDSNVRLTEEAALSILNSEAAAARSRSLRALDLALRQTPDHGNSRTYMLRVFDIWRAAGGVGTVSAQATMH